MRRPHDSRRDDEAKLLMLQLRGDGLTSDQIGAAFGKHPALVRVELHRIDREYAASEVADA